MYGRAGGLDRFKKAQTLEPFSVSKTAPPSHPSSSSLTFATPAHVTPTPTNACDSSSNVPQLTQIGGAQSTWQPPDWAIEPRPGLFYLEVLKDGVVLDRINLQRSASIFLEGSSTLVIFFLITSLFLVSMLLLFLIKTEMFVVDLGSAHGTFVANEILTKESPVELEVGQSLRFAASTRTYVMRKNEEALFTRTPSLTEINLPPPPDPYDEEALVAYNTLLKSYGISKSDLSGRENDNQPQ